MVESVKGSEFILHQIFLHFLSNSLEELYHTFKNEFRKKVSIQVFVILIYLMIVLIRGLLIYDSFSKSQSFIVQYELIWFAISLSGCALDLFSFYITCFNKAAGIFSIIICSYILGHSTYIYYFIGSTSGLYYFPAFVFPLTLVYLVSGIFVCYNYYIFVIALFSGSLTILITSFTLIPYLNMANKIGLPLLLFITCGCYGTASYQFELMIRNLFLQNEKNKERNKDLTNLFNEIPNEVLVVSKRKSIFTNNCFVRSFFPEFLENPNKQLTYDQILKLASTIKCSEQEGLTMKTIILKRKENSKNYQNKIFLMNEHGKNEQHFTYRFGRLEFQGSDSWVYIFNNMSITLELEKEKYDKKTKRVLLSQITHDMRTPINSMLCSEEVLENTVLSTDQRSTLILLKTSTQMLLNLVNDSLDLYLDEENSLKAACSNFDLKKLLKDSLFLLKHSFSSKGIALKLKIKDNLPDEINSDENRLRRIVINLLGNALKFTPRGGLVTVSSQFFVNKKLILISVKDSGPGISQENLANLFTRLGKLKDTSACNLTGLGIGLSVCKTLSKLLGGDISVSSQLTKGSKFTFWISNELENFQNENALSSQMNISTNYIDWTISESLSTSRFLNYEITGEEIKQNVRENSIDVIEVISDKNEVQLQTNHITKNVNESSNSKKALIVDDNVPTVDVLNSYCTKMNIRCDKCYNGAEAIEAIKIAASSDHNEMYDYVLLDNQMPIMGGIEALKQILNILSDSIKRPIFIIASGDSNEDIKSEVLSLNAIYVEKPISFTDFKKLLT